MRLTRFTDFSLRVLIYAGVNPERAVTISEIAETHDIPRNHLMKVVNHLATTGFLSTTRGNGGGIRLARSPNLITIGAVVRKMEGDMDIVECFNETEISTCALFPSCLLRGALMQAKESFLATLDKISLADCLPPSRPPTRSGLVRVSIPNMGGPPPR
jgi:Rrf2 family nitric oxide-sensitive transcriptional repressor